MITLTKPLALSAATAVAAMGIAFASPASAAPNYSANASASHYDHVSPAQDTQAAEHRRKRGKRWQRGRGYRKGYRQGYRQGYRGSYRQPVYSNPYPAPVYRAPVYQRRVVAQPYYDNYYQPYAPRNYSEPVYYNTQVWRERGYNNYYCRRRDGSTGMLIGAALGGLLGNRVAYRGERTAATLLGALNGAAIGRAIQGGSIRCR